MLVSLLRLQERDGMNSMSDTLVLRPVSFAGRQRRHTRSLLSVTQSVLS